MRNVSDVTVTAEWALWGGKSNAARRSLECSNGVVRSDNFRQLLTRYSPGTLMPSDLPQVTISWFEERKNGRRYVAVAIHHRPGHGDHDAARREAVLTSYFCVKFGELAAGHVSYMTMYEQFSKISLPVVPPDPIRTALPAHAPASVAEDADRRLAMRTAALLLTTEPVCVLGADQASLAERLRFIDTVASFLPYGMRSRLSASTLASSTYRTHKLRLFFASDDRRTGDRLVTWGRPEDSPIGHADADEYLALLNSDELTPAMLAERLVPVGFDQKGIARVLEQSRRRNAEPRWVARKARLPGRAAVPVVTPVEATALVGKHSRRPADDLAGPAGSEEIDIVTPQAVVAHHVADTPEARDTPQATDTPRAEAAEAEVGHQVGDLRGLVAACAYAMRHGDAAMLRSAAGELQHHARAPDDRLVELVREHRLFRPEATIDETVLRPFYVKLLQLMFATPLDYAGYCQVEMCAGYPAGERLHAMLALAMLDVGVRGPARLLLMNSLDDLQMRSALLQQPMSPAESVAIMADTTLTPAHARVVRDMAIKNLGMSQRDASERLEFVRALENHRLILVLLKGSPGESEYLLDLLTELLTFGYGGAMDGASVRRVLSGVPVLLAAPLLGATLRAVRPASRTAVIRTFVIYFLAGAGLAEDTIRGLRDLITDRTEPTVTVTQSGVQANENQAGRQPVTRARPQRKTGNRDWSWLLGLVILGLFVLSVIGLVNFFVQVLP
jgi:hypothetical protein